MMVTLFKHQKLSRFITFTDGKLKPDVGEEQNGAKHRLNHLQTVPIVNWQKQKQQTGDKRSKGIFYLGQQSIL